MELNNLKDKMKNSDIASILKYLKTISKNKKNVKFQKINGKYENNINKYHEKILFNNDIKNIDDIIIKLCIYNKQNDKKIWLLTQDRILRIKATVFNINALNITYL